MTKSSDHSGSRKSFWFAGASLSLALAVALGAIGAHTVNPDDAGRRLWDTALFWHVAHSLGVLALTGTRASLEPPLAGVAVAAIGAGMVAFCGTLYVQALTGTPPVPMAAPFGGLLLIFGWLLAALAAIRARLRD